MQSFDIGFEKNAFLHYWDIVPSNLDNGVEVVERANSKKRSKPKITQKDIPRLYPPGSEIYVQVTKGPIGTKGPRVTTHLALPGRYLVLLPNSDQSGVSRKIENGKERQRLKKIVRELNIPDGMGVIIRTAGENKPEKSFIKDIEVLLHKWDEIEAKMKASDEPTCLYREPDLIERTARDFITEEIDRVQVDKKDDYDRLIHEVRRIASKLKKKISFFL